MEDKRYALDTNGDASHSQKIELNAGETTFSFLPSGDLFEMKHGEFMLNQIRGNIVDGSMNNLFLRIHEQGEIRPYPLLGIKSNSQFYIGETGAQWVGQVEDVGYTVTFMLSEGGIWFWEIDLDPCGKIVDVIYGQDLGLAHPGMVQSNEAYASQYVDHKVFKDEVRGYVVCSRQNQPQGGKFPYIQQGSLTKAIAYSTDGYQFFGLSYKETDIAEVLTKKVLANEAYQYEFAYTALQSQPVTTKKSFVFYGIAKETQDAAMTELAYTAEIQAAWQQVQQPTDLVAMPKITKQSMIGAPLQTLSMSLSEIESYFPNRIQEEKSGDQLLSFFTDTYEHVVLKEKELLVERSHGHILLSGDHLRINEEIMTTTSYMYGVFNAQIVVGNTTMNKMMSNVRNGLNVMKTSGQRIYVETAAGYQLLTMPSMYEIGFNYTRWYYKIADELFVVTSYTTVDGPELRLTMKATSGKAYRYLVTNQVIMNEKEYEVPFKVTQDGQTISFMIHEGGFVSNYYPDLTYHLHVDGAKMTVADENKLVQGEDGVAPLSASLVVLDLSETNEFTITIQGLIQGGTFQKGSRCFETEVEKYRQHFAQVMNGFHLSLDGKMTPELEKMNVTAWWYTHNMFVHYLVPHGIEQYGGAAWGTRDVCQGPFEYFLAMGHHDVMRSILLKVFSYQFEDDGNWPQWFMFDKYVNIHTGDAHGDIIAWPLYVIGTYLTVTGDYSILDEEIPYLDRKTHQFTPHKETLFAHVQKEIDYIKGNFLHDTYLSCYGDGDWDDTLQPHDPKLKAFMASSWTVGLTYKGMKLLAKALREHRPMDSEKLAELVVGIERDFRKYILTTDVIPGFLYLEDPTNPTFMIHPTDEKLGIDYRLLPMQQSIIAELFTIDEAKHHLQIIREHLQCPDGVRLMNKPATYLGGVSSKFKRAEQAANFGREIGLQYVHAHIRFIEAMAKLGEADEVWKGFFVINPINIQDHVPNAEIRQSNAYFSSSDGKFNDRYEAEANFDKLRTGEVAVKGGWRIYSSGPGIYLNQFISNALGIRLENGMLILDPVLPIELDGLTFAFKVAKKPVRFKYRLGTNVKKVVVNGAEVVGEAVSNRYREGGFAVDMMLLDAHDNVIEIWV